MTVDRLIPTPTTHPGGINGSDYADQVSEEVLALWNYAITPVTIDSGTNTLIATAAVPFLALTTGNAITFSPLAANTGAVTINVDTLGAKAIVSAAGNALTAGMLAPGTLYFARYDGTAWRLTPDVPDLGALIDGYPAKATPVVTDLVAISDSEDSNNSKSVTLSQIASLAASTTSWTESVVVATTSGTTVDFTSLPAGLTEIELWLDSVSCGGGGTLGLKVQLGTGGTPTTSGYGSNSGLAGGGTGSGMSANDGLVVYVSALSSFMTGPMRLYRITGDRWLASHALRDSAAGGVVGGGNITLAGTLDMLRLLTTASFLDNGQIRLRYR